MNTTYECVLYLLNIYILYTTQDVTDILLNALAIEFVHQLDESYVDSAWWDTDFRYIKAGAIELVIRKYLNLHVLRDNKKQMTHSLLARSKSFASQSSKDGGSGVFMDANEPSSYEFRAKALLAQPKKVFSPLLNFLDMAGLLQSIQDFAERSCLSAIFCCFSESREAVFNRWNKYRDWIWWKKQLYPSQDDIDKIKANYEKLKEMEQACIEELDQKTTTPWTNSQGITAKDLMAKKLTEAKAADPQDTDAFWGYETISYEIHEETVLLGQVKEALFFLKVPFRLKQALLEGGCIEITLKIFWVVFESILIWFGMVVQILFPFMVLGLAFYTPYCY